MPTAIPGTFVLAARLIAIAGAVQALVYMLFGLGGFETWMRVPVAIWIALPLALAYWLGMRVARTQASFRLVLVAMAMAFGVSVWAYWEITWGETARRESLAGLLFIFGPLYQYGLLVPALAVAWLMSRRAAAS
jgi:hypothetical protein